MNINTLNSHLANKTAKEIIGWDRRRKNHGLQVMTTSFGIESALMLHLATSVNRNIPVIFINTGFLPRETLEFGLELTSTLELNLKVFKPNMTADQITDEFGKLWETDHKRYSWITKVEPLKRALSKLNATSVLHGVRAYQNDNRSNFKILMQDDSDHILRVHPILNWSEDDVRAYFKEHDLPYHPLLARGYGSVGDWHSTVPGPGRSGRWPGLDRSECGLHRVFEAGEAI